MKITEIWTICCKNCSVHHQRCSFQLCPWFWKLTKIYGSNWAKQNIPKLWSQLYFFLVIPLFLSIKEEYNRRNVDEDENENHSQT